MANGIINCPNCSAPIEGAALPFGSFICPHCGTSFVVERKDGVCFIPFNPEVEKRVIEKAENLLYQLGEEFYLHEETEYLPLEHFYIPILSFSGKMIESTPGGRNRKSFSLMVSLSYEVPFDSDKQLLKMKQPLLNDELSNTVIMPQEVEDNELLNLKTETFNDVFPNCELLSFDEADEVIYVPVLRQMIINDGEQEICYSASGATGNFYCEPPFRKLTQMHFQPQLPEDPTDNILLLMLANIVIVGGSLLTLIKWIFRGWDKASSTFIITVILSLGVFVLFRILKKRHASKCVAITKPILDKELAEKNRRRVLFETKFKRKPID